MVIPTNVTALDFISSLGALFLFFASQTENS